MTKTPPDLTEDARYFDRRAERQLELAQRAQHPGVVAAHCELADQLMTLRAAAEGAAR